MKQTRPLNNAIAWSHLGLTWLEMMAASGQVISRRTQRAQTPAQIFAMGSEKVAAALEATQAMSRHMTAFPSADPMAMWNAWARMMASGIAPYRSRAVRNARAGRRR